MNWSYGVLTASFSLQDLVVRTETNKMVTDLVDFDKVQSLLLMISQRRRFFAMREKARLQRQMEDGTRTYIFKPI